ncbi:MAG: hypothetical protein ACI8SE_001769 [Bacteroidia bacterium]|jgi:hypothetical protein
MARPLPNVLKCTAEYCVTSTIACCLNLNQRIRISLIVVFIGISIVGSSQNLDGLAKRDPLVLSGGISSGTSFYSANGREDRRNPFAYFLNVAPTLSVYGFDLPFSFTYRDQKGSFSKPFQRFDFNPSYKWVKLGIGNTSLDLSPYTMSGQYYKGFSVELTPKKWKIKGGAGNLENPLAQIDSVVAGTIILPTYKRKTFAGSVGYGGTEKFINLIYFKAKDDITATDLTTIDRAKLNPEENVVIGLGFGLPLFKVLTLKANLAGSVYSNNQESVKEFSSEDEKQLVTSFKDLFNYNISSKVQFAGDASLNLKIKKFGMGLQFKRVDPFYKSLGTYYFLEDYQNITVNMNFGLFKNKLRFNGSGGLQQNNLNELRESTRTRRIINATLSLAPSRKFNTTFRASNFVSDRTPVLTTLNDSLKFTQTSETYSIIPVLILKGKDKTKTFSAMVNYQKMIDLGLNLEGNQGVDNYTGNLSFRTAHNKTKTSLATSLLFNQNVVGLMENRRIGANVSGSKVIYKKLVSANATIGFTQNSINGVGDGLTFTTNIGFRYKIKKKISVALNANFLIRDSNIQSYQEVRGTFKVSYQFTTKKDKKK